METRTIDRLFLELSQFTQATTEKEIELMSYLGAARQLVETLGRSPLDDGSVLVLDTDWRALRRALGMEDSDHE